MLIDCKKKNVFRTHGMTKTITYKSWQCLIQRCLNKNNQRYKEYYGQKGVTVCDRWNVTEGGGLIKPWLGSVQECVNWIDRYLEGEFD